MEPRRTGSLGPDPNPNRPQRPRAQPEVVYPHQAQENLHPAAARLIAEIRASGEFTTETWQRLFLAMDDLADDDLAAVLEEIGRTVAKPASR